MSAFRTAASRAFTGPFPSAAVWYTWAPQRDSNPLLLHLRQDVAPSCQLRDQDASVIPHQRRVDVLVRPAFLNHGGNVQPRLVREGCRAHVGLARGGRPV